MRWRDIILAGQGETFVEDGFGERKLVCLDG